MVGAGGALDAGEPPDGAADAHPPVTGNPECSRVQLRARAVAVAEPGVTWGDPFWVPANLAGRYMCFEFDLGMTGPLYGAGSVKPLVTDGSHVAEMMLYKKQGGGTVANGAVTECLPPRPDDDLVAAWAPGAGDWELPPHVGLGLGEGKLVLQVQYVNPGAALADASGMELCVTRNPRRDTAGMYWLGIEALSLPPMELHEAYGTCRPLDQQEPVHVLASLPRMRAQGRHLVAVIDKADGGMATIADEPWDMSHHRVVPAGVTIDPGDSVRMTCAHTNLTDQTVVHGWSPSNALCYFLVMAYPERALVGGGLNRNSCVGT